MDFMPDVVALCEHCQGKRYNETVLKIRHRGKDIAEILDLTVNDATDFFYHTRRIRDVLLLLSRIGLTYLKLGQSLSMLSGGEAQRLYLAGEMQKPAKEPSLFLFDEPSAGLHFHDIKGLMTIFRELADTGHSLLIIEHDPMIISQADHFVELGPEGGDRGGYLISSSWNSQ
jgi:excinuclease ABC subunit A